MNDIFLSYGVRGIAGKTLTAEMVKKIAWAFGKTYPGAILLSHDARNSSLQFYRAAYSGLSAAGARILPVGLSTTPMAIFGMNHYKTDAGMVITASHNPPEWNGIKFFGKSAEPVGLESGLAGIRDTAALAPEILEKEVPAALALAQEYVNLLVSVFKPTLKDLARSLRVVIDNGNGAASIALERALKHFSQLDVIKLFWEQDGNFSGRGPNPFLAGALEPLRQKVRGTKADLGIAFDADADRIFFIDEAGELISADWILGWLADEFLSLDPKAKIVIPIGAPRIAEDIIARRGGEPIYSKVGFVSIRKEMKAQNAIFGGEHSGHYYFRDFFFADDGIWTMFQVLKFWLARNVPFSQVISPYLKYFTTGEINLEVRERKAVIDLLKKTYSPQARSVSELDGFFADLGDWWMLARVSNTEPLVRIVIESSSPAILEQNRQAVLKLLSSL